MKRAIFAMALLLNIGGCAPHYARGDIQSVQTRLLKIVPAGSSVAQLNDEVRRQRWTITDPSPRTVSLGAATYMRGCEGKGGRTVPVVVAQYPTPFTTSVETLWLFDPQDRLVKVCVRKTTDAF